MGKQLLPYILKIVSFCLLSVTANEKDVSEALQFFEQLSNDNSIKYKVIKYGLEQAEVNPNDILIQEKLIKPLLALKSENESEDETIQGPDGKSLINPNFSATLMPFWGYGCWCNFDKADFQGRGTPVDEADRLCRDASLCFECATIDGDAENAKCNPYNQDYTSTVVRNPKTPNTLSGISFTCPWDKNNFDSCSVRTCLCELNFISKIWSMMIAGGAVNNDYKHSNGKFDVAAQCQSNSNPHDKKCCGTYPDRKPFNSESNECCHDTRIYSPGLSKCCVGGKTVSHGVDCA